MVVVDQYFREVMTKLASLEGRDLAQIMGWEEPDAESRAQQVIVALRTFLRKPKAENVAPVEAEREGA